MPTRVVQRVPVKLIPGFDHQPSDLVDVFSNAEGEFVQVWRPGRKGVALTYLRTTEGPKSICTIEYLEQGEWSRIQDCEGSRLLSYRDGSGDRSERQLPSGKVLVVDSKHGLSLRSVFTAEFDWQSVEPCGRSLGNRAVMQRQVAGLTLFVTTYQETVLAGAATSELRCVEEHRGRDLVKLVEF